MLVATIGLIRPLEINDSGVYLPVCSVSFSVHSYLS